MTTPVASNGTLSAVYKAAAGKKAHIIFDVTGYFLPGTEDAAYNTLAPVRVLDSRAAYGIGLTGRFRTGVPRQLVLAGVRWHSRRRRRGDRQPDRGRPDQGRLRVDHAHERPQPDHLEHQLPGRRHPGQRAHGEAWTGGDIWLVYKGPAGSRTDLILDVTGYYLPAGDGLLFHALNPGRIMDTRTSLLSGLTGIVQPQRVPCARHRRPLGRARRGQGGDRQPHGHRPDQGRIRRRSRRTRIRTRRHRRSTSRSATRAPMGSPSRSTGAAT